MQLPNQPMMWQMCNAKNPADTGPKFPYIPYKHQNEKTMWSQWLWLWRDCWCQIAWFEYSCISGIVIHKRLVSDWLQLSDTLGYILSDGSGVIGGFGSFDIKPPCLGDSAGVDLGCIPAATRYESALFIWWCSVEKHLKIHNISNLEVDELQQ